MSANVADAKQIFLQAVENHEPERWPEFLADACGTDTVLRERVEALLAAYRQPNRILDGSSLLATRDHPSLAEGPGTVIGPYKLLQQIGEGGMGVVFMAEQTEPIQRTVALKIIKPGMDTRQVIGRFEAERQALAMMDHPNIARVLDAGTTGGGSRDEGLGTRASSGASTALDPRLSTLDHSSGRPYFVMDLVKGVPITDYCDAQHLTVRQRLELFTQVCHAVQHAHQKGIIHRDLKPSNVLVAEYDGRPVPKIIDFGVAKATAQRLTERTMFTQYGQIVGTLEYMSPEQARFNQLDVDTRSDIYSLGVLLYELLTGSTPFEKQRLETIAFDETLRIIREEEPPRPSTRLCASKSLPSIAANRQTEPARLSKVVSGELDWIVMKCLEKDRNRRYESASTLAADVLHYLADEPVSAIAPSRRYRAGKFIRRNKTAVIASAAVLVSLIAGVIGATVGLVTQYRQRAVAERAQVEAQLNLAAALQSQFKYGEAEQLYRKGLDALSGGTPEDRQRTADTLMRLAQVVPGDAETERLYREGLAAYRAAFPPGDPSIAHALITLGSFLRDQGRYAEAEPLLREAHEIHRRAAPADHYATGVSATYLGNVLFSLQNFAESEIALREAIAEHQLVEPSDAWDIALVRLELVKALVRLGRFPDAEADLLDAMQVFGPSDFYGDIAMVAFYTAWDQADPEKGHDAKGREWLLKLVQQYFHQTAATQPSAAADKPADAPSTADASPQGVGNMITNGPSRVPIPKAKD